ncbi:MAG: type IVB secretion system protein IcmH/DotU [Novosphingobium sp.]
MTGNDDNNNGNRTVFRPSPLQGLNPGGTEQRPGGSPLGSPAGSGVPDRPFGTPLGAPAPAPQDNAGWGAANPAAPPAGGYMANAAINPARSLVSDDVPKPPVQQQVRNGLMLEAGPILALAASIRCGRARAPLEQFHAKATEAVANFDRAIAGLYPDETRQRAKYAVCSTLDDIVQNLPGAEQDAAKWARSSMVVQTFHENIGGDRFWQLVDDMLARPAQHGELIELYHACLAAGFEGRFRHLPDGKRRLHEIMQQLYSAMDHSRSLSNQVLVQNWTGEKAPIQKVGFLSYIGLAAAVAAGVLLTTFIILLLVLKATGEESRIAIAQINPTDRLTLTRIGAAMPAPAAGAQSMRFKEFLADEIKQGLVKVEEDASTVRIRTTVGQLFRSASDQLEPGREALFQKIGQALETEKGSISIEGHTDSDAIKSLAFADNVELSGARANTVALIIAKKISDQSRIEVKAYGDSHAIESNDTAAGKSLNRRVEIVIPRQN